MREHPCFMYIFVWYNPQKRRQFDGSSVAMRGSFAHVFENSVNQTTRSSERKRLQTHQLQQAKST